jgi:hypothetical protein
VSDSGWSALTTWDARATAQAMIASFHFGPQESKLRFGEFTTFEISGQPVKTARDVSKMES